jgi:hypothetical protein
MVLHRLPGMGTSTSTLSEKTVDRCAAGAAVVVMLALGATTVAVMNSGQSAPPHPVPTLTPASNATPPAMAPSTPGPYLPEPRPRTAAAQPPRPVVPTAQQRPSVTPSRPVTHQRPARLPKSTGRRPDRHTDPQRLDLRTSGGSEQMGREVGSRICQQWGIPDSYCTSY